MNRKETKIIFVYSGKGGVGKSTFATNLAFSFSGKKVGLFDADLEGPSIPVLINGLKKNKDMFFFNMKVNPAEVNGIKVSSTGYITSKNENAFMSGRVLEGALSQLLFDVDWGVDVLVIDLPPGTGEVHRAIFSKLKGSALLVTTPQEVSYADTQRGIDFLKKSGIDILGIVENMSSYHCTNCGSLEKIYFGDTSNRLARPNNLNVLSSIPLMLEMSDKDINTPFVLRYPQHIITKMMTKIAAISLEQRGVKC